MSYPLGGMAVQNNDIGSAVIFGAVFDDAVFLGLAVSTTYPAGTVLGRVTASGKLSPSDVGAVDGTETPVAMLATDVITAAVLVDINIRVLIEGQVRLSKLIIAPATVGVVTAAQKDQLRDFGIVALQTTELSKLDNQA